MDYCVICGRHANVTRYGNRFSSRPGETFLCYAHDGLSGEAINATVEKYGEHGLTQD